MIRYLALGALLLGAHSAASAAWHAATSKHFIIYANQRPETLQRFATKLEKFDAAVRTVRGMEDPPVGDGGRLTIYVLDNSEAVSKIAVGKSSPIAGFYLPRAEGSVAFVPESASDWGGNGADTVFFHEYAHHLMLQNTSVAYPAWLVEGFAEFFSTARFPRSGDVEVGTPANHRSYGLFEGFKPSIEELLAASFGDGDAERIEGMYSRGWLLTHFLTFDPARRGQMSRYVQAIQTGKSPLEAAQAGFGDLKQLNRDLDTYLYRNRMAYLTVAAARLKMGAVNVRPLREGEARLMKLRMRSHRGVNKVTAPGIAAEMRTAAAPYPNDPAVQAALAEAEFDAGDLAAATTAADRALKVDPNFSPAIIYKGKALMAAGSKNPDQADWKAVRALFAKANKLDPEDPEPLILFYDSFPNQGKQPTPNAVKGLHYALLLAPQDQSLRMRSATELINEKKYADARRTLAPLAFSPHGGSGRDQARKMIDALSGNDPAAALRSFYSKTAATTE